MAKQWGKPVNVQITRLVLDPRLQGRDEAEFERLPADRVRTIGGLKFDKGHLDDLTEAVRKKEPLPRVRVIAVTPEEREADNRKKDPVLYVVNGYYRTAAHGEAGRANVPCEVRAGTWEEAIAEAVAANKDQMGKRRTNADKRRQVQMAVRELSKEWTNGKIAEHVGVSSEMVRLARAEAKGEGAEDEEPAVKTGADGRKYKTRRKGKSPARADDSWRYVELTKFMNIPPEVGEALDAAKVVTAGGLKKALDEGRDLGLTKKVLGQMKAELQAFIDDNTPPHVPNVKWEKLESEFVGSLARKIDHIAAEYRVLQSYEHDQAREKLKELGLFIFADWKKQLEKAAAKK